MTTTTPARDLASSAYELSERVTDTRKAFDLLAVDEPACRAAEEDYVAHYIRWLHPNALTAIIDRDDRDRPIRLLGFDGIDTGLGSNEARALVATLVAMVGDKALVLTGENVICLV